MFIVGLILIILALANLAVLFLLSRSADTKKMQFELLDKNLERAERGVREDISRNREETALNSKQLREEIVGSLKNYNDSIYNQFMSLTKVNEEKLDGMRKTVEERLKALQDDNNQKLEQIRNTVDEKLHATLEKRLGESFKLVSDRLELVHKGLGEMQSLAAGVGDLKKVLTNIKTRGTWGEIQLGNLLDQMLSPEQYARNIATKKGSRENVEFAIKMPGKDENPVWLPVDAKFPKEDYERLMDAQNQANPVLVEELSKALENRIKAEAKDIRDKYIDPPNTTDFGVLFVPIEGLFAEILRRQGLCEFLQREYRVTVTGPANFAAFLNSLQMGFATVAISKRASEVWNTLAVVKTEFGKFGDILDKTQKKLQEASNTIEDAARKSRTIERKLRDVEMVTDSKTAELIEKSEESAST
jgi:DNA recombination protein RmuC